MMMVVGVGGIGLVRIGICNGGGGVKLLVCMGIWGVDIWCCCWLLRMMNRIRVIVIIFSVMKVLGIFC